MNNRYFLLLLVVVAVGCDTILGPDPANDPASNFDIFWKDFDKYYSQFSIRQIDWDSVYTVTKPRITVQTSDRQLFDILANIVSAINDMHVTLYSSFGDVYYQDISRGIYPSSKLVNPGKYLIPGYPQRSVMEYRSCKDTAIGYLIIPTFQGGNGLNLRDDRYLMIDDVLQQFKNTNGLIIDVRWNSGGNSVNAETVAGRFADQKRLYMTFCSKNGPGRNDFSAWRELSIEPRGGFQYTKPVVVLASRATCSSAETFVMAMKVLPQVTIVGDTTGGGVGNPIFRELPNGWTYRMSTGIAATADGTIMEGRGIPPDIQVQTTVADSINGVDRIMEKGIEIIRNAKRN
jgi:hypothetical protein